MHKSLARSGVFVLVSLLAATIVWVARFSASSYPAYSSLRSDPEGASLLFEGLERTGNFDVIRSYVPAEISSARDSTVLYLGVSPRLLFTADGSFCTRLERIANAGNRVILGLTNDWPKTNSDKLAGAARRRWQLESFKSDSSLVERSVGNGGIVIVPHAERLANLALARTEEARKLASALVRSRRTIIFDEAHLGVEETGSVGVLIKRYRLRGLVAGILALVILFFWSRAVAFPPPSSFEEDTASSIRASDSHEMLAGLFSRHLSLQKLMRACIAEWNRTHPRQPVHMLPGEDELAAYLRIQEQLQKKSA